MALDFKDLGKLKWYYQALLVAGVCGGLLALFWYQFLTPIDADIQARMASLDELQKTIAKSLQQQKQLAQIKKEAIELGKAGHAQVGFAVGERNGPDFPVGPAAGDNVGPQNRPRRAAPDHRP